MKRAWPLLIVVLALAGCNTMQGFGKDIQKVGDQIEEKARKK